MKKILLVLLVLVMISISLFASVANESENDEFLDEILISDIPITYGDELFRERILARTKGERDPIGLVLTGGSARACAHIGVLRYLDEIGLKPDFIVSNSMGSIIGMLYAAGMTPDQIEQLLLAGDISSYFSLTLPAKGGFLDATGFKTLIDYIFGKNYKIEDTDIPIMVIEEDLVSKREVRITEGAFSDILIGSFALPAYFSPYKYKGHLLIDGGVISLAPIDVAYDYTDTVILSSTFYDADTTNLINPVTILNFSFDIGKRQNASRDLKKYYSLTWIRCDVENYSFMDFDKAEEMAEIGYSSARRHKDELESLIPETEEEKWEEKEEFSSKIEKMKKSLQYFGRLKTSSPTTMFGIDFSSLESELSPFFFKNSLLIGFEYRFLFSTFDICAYAGLSNNAQNLIASEWATTLGAQVSWYPFSNTRVRLDYYSDFLRSGAAYDSFLTAREAIDIYAFNNEDGFLLIHQGLDYAYDEHFRENKRGLIGSIIVNGEYNADEFSVGGDAGYLLTLPTLNDVFNYGQVSARFEYNLTKNIVFDASCRIRFSLDKKGSVPTFIYDNYTSQSIKYGLGALRSSSSSYSIFSNASLSYHFHISPTFGEFLILDNCEMGLYYSSLNTKEGYGFSIGIEMKTDASLIGLVKLPVVMRIGYERGEELTNNITASLSFSSVF